MLIRARFSCQRFLSVASACLILGGLLANAPAAAFAQSSAARAPELLPWQRDLAAAHVLQTAAALNSSRDPAASRAEQQHLAQLYRALAARYPAEPAVQRAAGDYLNLISETDLAVPYWRQAEVLDLKDGASAQALGAAALARGDVREARDQFQRAVDSVPGEAAYHFDLANVLYMFRHQLADPSGVAGAEALMAKSLEQYRLAASLAPADASLAQAYAETFYNLAKPDWAGALAAWEKVRLLDAPKTDFANGNLARISLLLGQPDAADQYLDAINDPGFAGLKASLRAKAVGLRRQQGQIPAP